MLGGKTSSDRLAGPIGVLAFGAIAAGAFGFASQNSVQLPKDADAARQQRNLTKAAWGALAGTGILAVIALATADEPAAPSPEQNVQITR